MYVFNLAGYLYLEQNEPFSTLKTLIGSMYFFQKLPQFSQGKNVLDVEAYNTDGFLWRVTFVSSTQLNRPIWTESLSGP
jgi:hypothetical protein